MSIVAGHHRPHPRALDDAPQLGGVGSVLRGARATQVLTPAYPGFEVEVEALREDPTPIADADRARDRRPPRRASSELDTPPIIMGHSFGGTLTQLLLDRGFGAAGVAIDSAPTEGVHVSPLSQIKSLFPALKDPRTATTRSASRTTVPLRVHEHAERGGLAEVYDRYHIPAPATGSGPTALFANFKPGHQETWVNYKNTNRAPLLFIAGSEDHIMPPSVNQSNAKHYSRDTITEYYEFEGRDHWTCGAPGWEAVADYALEWAVARATGADVTIAAPA